MSARPKPNINIPDPLNIKLIQNKKYIDENWRFFIGIAILMIGWYVAAISASNNNTKNKLIELKTAYVIDAYTQITKSMRLVHRGLPTTEIEEALTNVQLFGTSEQIREAHAAIKRISETGSVNVEPLLQLLREDLRKQVGIELETSPIETFVVDTTKKEPGYYIKCPVVKRNVYTGYKEFPKDVQIDIIIDFICSKCGEVHQFNPKTAAVRK